MVLLEEQELTQNDVGLVVALGNEPFAQNLSDAGQVRDGLLVHGLGHEVTVLLRCAAHSEDLETVRRDDQK